MEPLYTPWRAAYQKNTDQRLAANNTPDDTSDHTDTRACPFCLPAPADDTALLVVKRYTHCYVIMNRYPYNPGHVMVIPYVHTPTITTLAPDVLAELMSVTSTTMRMLQAVLECQGFNVGMHIGGAAAGGSVPDHVHQHVLPRWQGDTGFLPALYNLKAMAYSPQDLYPQLVAQISS